MCDAQINLFRNEYAWPPPPPEVEPPFVIVVAAASQLDQVDTRLAAKSARVRMVELHETALVAPMAVRTDVAATPEVTHPDRALDRGRGVLGPALRAPRDTRLLGGGELLLRELLEQGVEGAVEKAASSPVGTAWLSVSLASRIFSSVSPLMVTWSL